MGRWQPSADRCAGIPSRRSLVADGSRDHQATTNASDALQAAYTHADLFFGNMTGSAGEMSKLAVLLGAAYLIFTGIGSWRVMLAGVLSLVASGPS